MSRKTRKLIWSVPLVVVLAIAGALTIFVALAPSQAQAAHALPGPVTGLKAEAKGTAEIKLTWKAPTGGTVTGYRIDISDYDPDMPNRVTHVWESHVANIGNRTSYTDTTGLSANSTRYYRVFALNSAGTGPVSTDPNFAWADTLQAGTPGPAGRLTARGVSSSQIELSWGAPSDDGGAKITHYCINVSKNNTEGSIQAFSALNCSDTVTADPASITSAGMGTIVVAANKTSYEHMNLGTSTKRGVTVSFLGTAMSRTWLPI